MSAAACSVSRAASSSFRILRAVAGALRAGGQQMATRVQQRGQNPLLAPLLLLADTLLVLALDALFLQAFGFDALALEPLSLQALW
jgi:hypothetical protein